MNHTEKYKFNLIESSDTFSPEPLNKNMELVEAQLNAVRSAGDSGDAALDKRIRALEAHRIACAAYTGDGTVRTISLGFAPDLVIVQSTGAGSLSGMAVKGYPHATNRLVLTSSGFTLINGEMGFNVQGGTYVYFAVKW